MHAIADVIDYGDGNITISNPDTKYGPSAGLNPNGTSGQNMKDLETKAKELRKAKKALQKKKRKTNRKRKEERAKLQEEIDNISKELKKVFRDHANEKKMRKSPRRPRKKKDRHPWEIQERKKYLDELKEMEKERLEREKRNKKKAKKVTALENLGGLTIGNVMTDVLATQKDVMENQDTVGDIKTELKKSECDEVTDENAEICYELNITLGEASSTLKQNESKLAELTSLVPPLMLGGGIYYLWDALKDSQGYQKHLNTIHNELELCLENCQELQKELEFAKETIAEIEDLSKDPLTEIQNDIREMELNEEVKVQIIVPNYLAQNTDIPFAHREELPIAVGLAMDNSSHVVKAANLVVNGQSVPLTYYSEASILAGTYKVQSAEEILGAVVVVETIDGQVFSQSIGGRIFTKKPEVNIQAVDGSIFKKGKFKVDIKGEFDRIELSGTNIKSQVISFGEVKNHHKMTVRALSKGPASLKVVATRTTKTIELPEFDGQVLSTDFDGNVLREDDYYRPLNFDANKRKNKEMGWCCEDIGAEGLCEGCMLGKRSRNTCSRLKKMGFDIKAFLRQKDMKCIKL